MSAPIGCAVIAVGGDRDERAFLHAERIVEQLTAAGHTSKAPRRIKSDSLQIKGELAMLVQSQSLRAIFLTSGEGIGLRDRTSEATAGLLDRRLDGFGELLRGLLFPAIGPRAMLARSAAGVQHRRLVFALPADPQAIDIALQKLVLPQLEDLVAQLGHGR